MWILLFSLLSHLNLTYYRLLILTLALLSITKLIRRINMREMKLDYYLDENKTRENIH